MAVTWDANYKVDPEGGDNPSVGDDEIRSVRGAIEERMVNEHTTFADGTLGNYLLDWNHKAGSAKGFFQNAAPTLRPNGSTALGTDDKGRIWFDDDNSDVPYYWDGAAWTGLILNFVRVSIQGGLAVGGNIVPAIIMPIGGKIVAVYARVATAPTGAALRIDFEKNGGGNSIFGTNDYVEIAAAANAGSSTDIDGTNGTLAAGDYLEMDIDQVGSTVAGADLSIAILYRVG